MSEIPLKIRMAPDRQIRVTTSPKGIESHRCNCLKTVFIIVNYFIPEIIILKVSLGRFPDLARTLPAFPPDRSDHYRQVDKRLYSSWHCAGFTPASLAQTLKMSALLTEMQI